MVHEASTTKHDRLISELKGTSARQEGAIAEVQRSMVVLAENARLTTLQLERVGMTLLDVAEDTKERFADHEERIAALEAKSDH